MRSSTASPPGRRFVDCGVQEVADPGFATRGKAWHSQRARQRRQQGVEGPGVVRQEAAHDPVVLGAAAVAPRRGAALAADADRERQIRRARCEANGANSAAPDLSSATPAPPVAHALLTMKANSERFGSTCALLTPAIKTRLKELESGQVLEVRVSDSIAREDIGAWCRLCGLSVSERVRSAGTDAERGAARRILPSGSFCWPHAMRDSRCSST